MLSAFESQIASRYQKSWRRNVENLWSRRAPRASTNEQSMSRQMQLLFQLFFLHRSLFSQDCLDRGYQSTARSYLIVSRWWWQFHRCGNICQDFYALINRRTSLWEPSISRLSCERLSISWIIAHTNLCNETCSKKINTLKRNLFSSHMNYLSLSNIFIYVRENNFPFLQKIFYTWKYINCIQAYDINYFAIYIL